MKFSNAMILNPSKFTSTSGAVKGQHCFEIAFDNDFLTKNKVGNMFLF